MTRLMVVAGKYLKKCKPDSKHLYTHESMIMTLDPDTACSTGIAIVDVTDKEVIFFKWLLEPPIED